MLRGKSVESSYVEDVGQYFPFLNREAQLTKLWKRMKSQFAWKEDGCGNKDSYKLSGAVFTVCCGASGIGKTSFSTDGVYAIARRLEGNTKPEELLRNCVFRNLVFRLSFVDVPLTPDEKSYPEIIVPYRVLHQYVNSTKTTGGFSSFIETYFPKFGRKLTLKAVCDFIAFMGKTEDQLQLVIIHIDETQKKYSLFYQIIESLWTVRNDPKSTTLLFPILSGTNALDLYSQFASSSYKYHSLDLPLLKESHLVQIVQSLISRKSKSNLKEKSLLAQVMYMATKGHPRLIKSFISVGSAQQTKKEIHIYTVAKPFFKDGFMSLLEKQDDPEEVWRIVAKTTAEIEFDQFPEQRNLIQTAG